MAILVKIKVANNGVRIVYSSCVKWEYLGQGGFNPVKTDCEGGKGKSGLVLHEVGHMAGREEAEGHSERGQHPPPTCQAEHYFQRH